MSLLAEAIAFLERRGVVSALIGGSALAVHGVVRSTLDDDLLVLDGSILHVDFWKDWPNETPKIRTGDFDDPLAGVVRIARAGEMVEVVVGKGAWQAEILSRRRSIVVDSETIPVVDAADLVLLKLHAAGAQDRLDVELLRRAGGAALEAEVETRLEAVPKALRALWRSSTK